MKLSFVIPAYNEERHIGLCLDSIFKELRGTSYDVEVIVVNNASTDRTREIAARYKEARIVDEPRKGLVWARRAGFLASTGDLIANIDADTILPSGWLKKAFDEFGENQKLIALSGPYILYDLPPTINFFVKTFFFPISFLGYMVNRFILRGGSMVLGGNYVIRKWALQKIGGYNTEIGFYGEDADISRRAAKLGPVKFTYKFPIYTSGRRIAKEGAFTMGVRYGANYLSMMIFQRPKTKTYVDVRIENGGEKLKYEPENKSKEWTIASITIIILFAIIAGLGFGAYRLGIVIARLLFL
ncbi:MAG: glycosyltransferase family 2 protein [Candidatus Liptonbacteria bacterium]|nr:glycosyltransferase family 2 protein [Candidatus Liptonbacteria bacterium]